MPEYIRTEHGLPQRVWPNKQRESAEERIRRYRRSQQEANEGPVHFDRAPGEIDRGSSAYRLEFLKEAIRKYSQHRRERPQSYEDDGWC